MSVAPLASENWYWRTDAGLVLRHERRHETQLDATGTWSDRVYLKSV